MKLLLKNGQVKEVNVGGVLSGLRVVEVSLNEQDIVDLFSRNDGNEYLKKLWLRFPPNPPNQKPPMPGDIKPCGWCKSVGSTRIKEV